MKRRESFERCGFKAANDELDRLADKLEYRLVGYSGRRRYAGWWRPRSGSATDSRASSPMCKRTQQALVRAATSIRAIEHRTSVGEQGHSSVPLPPLGSTMRQRHHLVRRHLRQKRRAISRLVSLLRPPYPTSLGPTAVAECKIASIQCAERYPIRSDCLALSPRVADPDETSKAKKRSVFNCA